jgi:D-lactate dehydrogenase
MTDPSTDFLNNSEVFSSLDKATLESLKHKFSRVTFEKNEFLFQEGELGDRMFILTEGLVEVLKRNEEGHQVKVAERGVGSMIGMTSLFYKDNKRSATLRALKPTEAWSLDKKAFEEELRTREDLVFNFFAYMSKEMRKETVELARLLSPASDGRYKLAFFDAKKYEKRAFDKLVPENVSIDYHDARLSLDTVSMAIGAKAVCVFVNDEINREVIQRLSDFGVELIALRCAGFNNVDLEAAKEFEIAVTRVPAYSPHAVAEHALALMLTLNRKTHFAYNRVREGNFYLNRLVGFDMHGRTAGVVGTGKIGKCMALVLKGLGMNVLLFDVFKDEAFAQENALEYADLDTLFSQSDIITLHVPLLKDTYHIIDEEAISKMKDGVMLINTSRGGLVDAKALIRGLKSKKIGSAGLDVYEEESEYFFADHSGMVIDDDVLTRLISFPNVLITSHQAFLTEDALHNIADTTLASVKEVASGTEKSQLTYSVIKYS